MRDDREMACGESNPCAFGQDARLRETNMVLDYHHIKRGPAQIFENRHRMTELRWLKWALPRSQMHDPYVEAMINAMPKAANFECIVTSIEQCDIVARIGHQDGEVRCCR